MVGGRALLRGAPHEVGTFRFHSPHPRLVGDSDYNGFSRVRRIPSRGKDLLPGLACVRAARIVPVSLVNGAQQIVEMGRILDWPEPVEGGAEKADVPLGQQTDGNDPVLCH